MASFRKTLAGLQTSFASADVYRRLAREPEIHSAPGSPAAAEDQPAILEFRASVLSSGVSNELDVFNDVDDDSGDVVAACRNELHDCVAYQHVLDSLKVTSGDLVEVANPDTPSVTPRIARIWAAGENEVLLKEDVKISPFLAYNLGIPYHLTAFFKGTNSGAPEFPVCLRRYTYGARNESLDKTMSKDGNGRALDDVPEDVLVANPSSGKVRVRLAKRVCLKAVREPDPTGDFLPEVEEEEEGLPGAGGQKKDQSSGGGHEQVNSGFADPEEETASVCLDAYFGSDVRMVALGDVIGIPVPASHMKSPGMTVAHINAGVETRGGGRNPEGSVGSVGSDVPPQILYFKVTSVWPSGGSLSSSTHSSIKDRCVAVDCELTTVSMEGVTSSGYPVGAKEYLFGSGRDQSSNKASKRRSRCLGTTSQNAPGRDAELEHVGQLLPTWESIAHVVACTIHPQSTMITMRPAILLHGPHGAGKRTATRAAAAALGCHFISLSCEDIRPEGMPDDKVVETLDAVMNIAGNYKPVILVLRDVHLLAQASPMHPNVEAQGARIGAALERCIAKGLEGHYGDDDMKMGSRQKGADGPFPHPIFTIATTSDPDDVEPGIRRCFTHEILADAPDADGRRMLLDSFLSNARRECSIEARDIDNMVQHTAGLLPLELKNVAAEAYAAAVLGLAKQSDTSETSVATAVVQVPDLSQKHVDSSIVSVRNKTASEIGAPKIPNVEWDDVGGLEDVKLGILDTVELPLKHPELFAGGLRRRSGVLLYGPPGTGKTLLAKAVATEVNCNFLSVKGPELINMYVGESERLIREVFAKARRARPCIIFFDELDSLAPGRGKGSDSGGIMDRIVSQLLAEIDSAQGGSGSDDVFIIGATNRPDLLDAALLRPGRLDKLLYVGIASSPRDRKKVLAALSRKFNLDDSVDFDKVATSCPSRLTGADMYGLCSRAWMRAFKRHIEERDGREAIVVSQEDFLYAAATVTPSLSAEDLAQYQALRQQHAGQEDESKDMMPVRGAIPTLPPRRKDAKKDEDVNNEVDES